MVYGIFFATGVCLGAIFGFLVAKCAITPPDSIVPVSKSSWIPGWEWKTTTRTTTITEKEN